jgi:hypothetical protein
MRADDDGVVDLEPSMLGEDEGPDGALATGMPDEADHQDRHNQGQ